MSNAPKRFETLRTAYDVKWVHRELADAFRDDELQRISLLPRGHRLEQGATYFDLCDGREFRSTADQVVARDGCVVAKSDVDYELWNRLLRVKVSPTDPRAIRARSRELTEKQKAKAIYGISERQFRRYFATAQYAR
jgi:hypothetical protein